MRTVPLSRGTVVHVVVWLSQSKYSEYIIMYEVQNGQMKPDRILNKKRKSKTLPDGNSTVRVNVPHTYFLMI